MANTLYRWTSFAALLFLSTAGWGQFFLPQLVDSAKHKYELQLRGIVDYSSTAIQRDLFQSFNNGGMMSADLIAENANRQKAQNYLGLELLGQLDWINFNTSIGKRNWGYILRAGHYSYFSSQYTADAFRLVFQGNQSFSGDTAHLSGTEFNGVSLQKVGWGLIDKKSRSSVVLNLVGLTSYQRLSVIEGYYSRDSTTGGESVKATGEFLTTPKHPFYKGIGLSFDLDFRMKTLWLKDREAIFQFSVQNVGLAYLPQMNRYLFQTDLEFNGWTLGELSNADSSDFSEEWKDTLGLKTSQNEQMVFLPAFVQVGKLVDENSEAPFQSYFGARIYTTLNYRPMAYAGLQFQWRQKLRTGLQLSYGGFTLFRTGMYLQYTGEKWRFGLGSEDLYGALSPRGKGQSLFINLNYAW